MRRTVKALLRNRGVRWGLIVVALLLIFEVTAHYLPPDGVTVTATNYVATPNIDYTIVTTSRTTNADTAQTRAEIDSLNNGFNTAPTISTSSIPTLPRGGGCMTLAGYTEYRVTFTWHSLPLRVWTNNTPCPFYTENSGGIPTPWWSSDAGDGPALHALQ